MQDISRRRFMQGATAAALVGPFIGTSATRARAAGSRKKLGVALCGLGYVVTPNALHLEHTVAAAKAGKHVYCEKPLEISVERCQQMIRAAAR